MIVLIDNYDSFSYKVYRLMGSVKPEIKVFGTEDLKVKKMKEMKREARTIKPAPGKR